MFKTSTLTEWNKSKSKPTQVRFADLFFNVLTDVVFTKFAILISLPPICLLGKHGAQLWHSVPASIHSVTLAKLEMSCLKKTKVYLNKTNVEVKKQVKNLKQTSRSIHKRRA